MNSPESILIADIGSVKTKVGLIDRVGDQYRVIGMGDSLTTIGAQGDDVLVGVRRAIEQIQERISRRLLTAEGELTVPESQSGQGVDAFVAVTSAPAPLRISIVGLSREVSVAAAARAVNSTYARVETTIALDQMGGPWGPAKANGKNASQPAAKLQDPAVLAAEMLARDLPDVIVLVGGIDGGATNALYEIASLIAAIVTARDEDARPIIVFAGNREARTEIAARLGAIAPLRVVDNVHPALDRENPLPLQHELEALYEERRLRNAPAFDALGKWLSVPLMTTARSFEYVIRFLAAHLKQGVLGVDIGGTSTTLVTARGDSYSRVVRSDLGLGTSVERILAQVGAEQLVGWVPGEELTVEGAHARWLNRAAHPATIPATQEERHLTQALAREALIIAARDAAIDMDGISWVITCGGVFSRNLNQGGLVLLALDALQPTLPVTVAVDSLGLLSAFGAVALVNPVAAANVIEEDGYVPLAAAVTASSFYREGTVEVRVKMQSPGMGDMNVEVQHGNLELIPVEAGKKATLQLRPAPGVSLSGARSRRGWQTVEIEGGALGLIVDARGRPVIFPAATDKRRSKTQEWLWDVGG